MDRPKDLQESLPKIGRLLRRFRPYTSKHRPLIGASMFAVAMQVVLRLVEPWPLKIIFDGVLANSLSLEGFPLRVPILEGWLVSLSPMALLTISSIALVTIVGLRAVSWYYAQVGFAIIGTRVTTDIQNDLYKHVQRLPLSFHAKARGGDLIVRIIADIGMMREALVTAALPLFANSWALGAMIVVMFWLNPSLALISLLVLPLFWLSSRPLARDITRTTRRQRKRQSAMASTASESIGAIQVVQALSLEGRFYDDFKQETKENLRLEVRGKRLAARMERSLDVLIGLGLALVLWFGVRDILAGTLTPGDLLVFLAYLRTAYRPLQDFAKYSARLAKGVAAGERIVDIMDRVPEVRDSPNAVRAPAFRGEVWFDDVNFAYEPGHPVLEHATFCAKPGRLIALVGPSGMGKSTVANLLLRLYDPQGGRVTIDGHDIRLFTLASLRRQMSVVLQDTLLFHATVRDNIAFGAPDTMPEEVEGCARLANAHDFITALPRGYDTILGERGVTLSRGQRQRIAIARAAIRKSPILILDEPTTGLDEENERAVLEALERLSIGRTTFLMTHDLRRAIRSDLVLFLEGNRIAEAGTHEELLRRNGRYATLYRLQVGTGASEVTEEAVDALPA